MEFVTYILGATKDHYEHLLRNYSVAGLTMGTLHSLVYLIFETTHSTDAAYEVSGR